jgi:hypothetical protein
MAHNQHPQSLSGAVGNQRLPSNWFSNTTSDQLTPPVSATALANWIGLGEPTPEDVVILDGLIAAATQWFVDHCSHEVSAPAREYLLQWDRIPERQAAFSGLGYNPSLGAYWVDLPRYPVIEVSEVTSNNEVVDPQFYTVDTDSRPCRLLITRNALGACQNIYPLKVTYSAGYAAAAQVPASITQGILMMCAYLYEHRGACDVGTAAVASGAQSLWGGNCLILGGL